MTAAGPLRPAALRRCRACCASTPYSSAAKWTHSTPAAATTLRSFPSPVPPRKRSASARRWAVPPSARRGSDLALSPLDGAILICPLSPKGKALVEPHVQAGPRRRETIGRWRRSRPSRSNVPSAPEPLDPAWPSDLEQRFDDEVWQQFGELCLSCSVCASVCPTCTCFDMAHDGTAWGGAQYRCWDACTFPHSPFMPRATTRAPTRRPATANGCYTSSPTRPTRCGDVPLRRLRAVHSPVPGRPRHPGRGSRGRA